MGLAHLAVGDGNATACRHDDLLPGHRDGYHQLAGEPLGDGLGLRRVLEVLADDHEFIAAEPTGSVRVTQCGREASADLDQELVAGVVPEAVVHHLEVVEVDEKHREHLAGAGREPQRVLEPVQDQDPIG